MATLSSGLPINGCALKEIYTIPDAYSMRKKAGNQWLAPEAL
jgi:hypothetical protein